MDPASSYLLKIFHLGNPEKARKMFHVSTLRRLLIVTQQSLRTLLIQSHTSTHRIIGKSHMSSTMMLC
jgi:hypothetical protein